MDLLMLGAGMGIVGGMLPNPLQLIALTQVAVNRWARAILIVVAPQLVLDGALLLVTFLFYLHVPSDIAYSMAYVGGAVLLVFAGYSLATLRGKSQEEIARSDAITYAGVSVATLAELTAPGTWIYWLTIAGPIIAEGRQKGYWQVVPFFAGSLLGYYGAAIVFLCLMAWGASLHKQFKQRLLLIANVLLLVLGVSYIVRAYFAR